MAFLVGVPRSGTNWLQKVLASHPGVAALPSETHLFSHGLRHLDTQVQHGLLTSPATGTVYLPRREWVAAMRSFCVLTYARVAAAVNPTATVVVERSPQHVEHLRLIGEVFPDAAYLHIIRDGRDVARSLARQEWGPPDISAAASEWARGVRSARAAAAGLARYREVRYEQLLSRPREEVAGVFEWLGLNCEPRILDDALAAAGVAVNVDVSNPRIGVGKWRDEWTARDLAAFRAVAGDLLDDLGYPDMAVRRHRVAASTFRAAAAAVLSRLRPPEPGPPEHAPVVTRMEGVQILVDRFLAAAADGRVAPLPAGDVRVQYSGPETGWTATGANAVEQLAAAWRGEGPWGRQVRAAEQILGSAVVVTMTHHDDGHEPVNRVVVLGLDEAGAITHIGYTRFPAPGEERSPR